MKTNRKGGYSLAKSSDEISLYDVISSTEVTMAINKCLETNGVCSRNCIGTCRIRKILFNLQTSFNYKLQSKKINRQITSHICEK